MAMRVVLSDSSLVDDLVGQLRALNVEAEREGENAVRVRMPPPAEDEPSGNPPDQDLIELTFVVRVWQREHPETSFTVEK
jgi:hypothetical protein